MEDMSEREYQEMYNNALRYRMFCRIITGSEAVQAQAQAAVANVMRGQPRLTEDLVDKAMDAALASFGVHVVRTQLGG